MILLVVWILESPQISPDLTVARKLSCYQSIDTRCYVPRTCIYSVMSFTLLVWSRHPCSKLRKMAVSLFALSLPIILVTSAVSELFTSNFKTYYGLASTLPPYKSSSFKNFFGCARWCSKEICCYAYQFTNTTRHCHLLTRKNMQNIAPNPGWNIAADQAIGKLYIAAIS